MHECCIMGYQTKLAVEALPKIRTIIMIHGHYGMYIIHLGVQVTLNFSEMGKELGTHK